MTDHQPPTPAADRGLHSQTRAIRSGRRGDDRSLAPVLWATSTFWSSSVDEARKMATMAGAVTAGCLVATVQCSSCTRTNDSA